MGNRKLEIGKRVKKLRIASGLDWREFAKALRLSTQTLSHYESGQNFPATQSLLAISKFCGVSIDWILTGKEFEKSYKGVDILARSAALKNLDTIPIYFIRWFGWNIKDKTRRVSNRTLLKMERHFTSALKLLRKEGS